MSHYEKYDNTAKNYDKTRLPIGVDIIQETFRRSDTPLEKQIILDAGCGTGNYAMALVKNVGKIFGLEGNQAMLQEAEKKLKESSADNYELKQGILPKLPLEDESVDGITINQVIHQLDVEPEHPVLREFCQEAMRVLKKGGSLIINTCSHEQLRDAIWYCEFIPLAVDRSVKRYPAVDLLVSMLADCGFRDTRLTVPVEELFFGESYTDLDGPSKTEWRDGDSLWALLSESELKVALEAHAQLRDSGKLPELFERSEKRRNQIGQTVFVSTRKTSSK